MDTTRTKPLSAPSGDQSTMSYDRQAAAATAFSHLGPRNPISQLDEPDRMFLWALLVVYARSANAKQDGVAPFEPLDIVHKLVADAAKLAKGLESEVFAGPLSEMLLPYTQAFQELPSRIAEFSAQLKAGILTVGKPGYQQSVFANTFLVRASELVRLKTGQHYDEHLAELFQGISGNGGTQAEELSGDAIRKKRMYLASKYPDLYAHSINEAAKTHTASVSTA